MITILIYAIFIRVVLSLASSFIGPKLSPSNNKLVSVIYDITDPLLKPFQRFQIGGPAMAVDFSPILAIFALNFIQWLLAQLF